MCQPGQSQVGPQGRPIGRRDVSRAVLDQQVLQHLPGAKPRAQNSTEERNG